MKHDWRSVRVGPDQPVFEVLDVMNRGAMRVVLVVDGEQKLLGIVTDGDVRRAFLHRIDVEAPVSSVMTAQPAVANISDSQDQVRAMMANMDLDHIPLVDDQGRLVGLKTLQELARPSVRENWVVIMAGGLGSRLGDLTQNCPKPLLNVGSQPILEIILESFIENGFRNFFFSVNYKKEMIQAHFGDGARWGVRIEYLEETRRLGTAGSLGLLPEKPSEPFFVMNGDLLTRINFANILDFHRENDSVATMCVRKMEQTIPYGVVEMESHRLVRIKEKPVHDYFVNAGIYLLNPEVLHWVPKGGYFDMTDLFRRIMEAGQPTAAFPFLEYWLDIGRMGDFQQACRDYPDVFE